MGNIIVPVDDRLCSTLRIGSDAFPFMLFHDDLSRFAQGFVNWHRQKEIEISCILEGSVRVCLLKEEHQLHAGDCFIILPGALHSIQPVAGQPGKYFTLIFSPGLLTGFSGSFFEQTWYSPVIASAKGYHGIPDIPKNAAIRAHLSWIYENAESEGSTLPLEIQRRLQDIWLLLCAHVFSLSSGAACAEEDNRILEMINDLRTHYTEKFSLMKMAERLYISRGECCRYFKKMMGMTLTEYLIDYRLSKAAECLALSQMNIGDIALRTGFSSPSSFSAEFKKKLGCTPSEYRAAARQKTP